MALTAVFALLDPPTEELGNLGWAIVAVSIVGGLAGAYRLFDLRQTVAWREIYALSYVGRPQRRRVDLARGRGATPYTALLGMVVSGSALNPPRRSLPVLLLRDSGRGPTAPLRPQPTPTHSF